MKGRHNGGSFLLGQRKEKNRKEKGRAIMGLLGKLVRLSGKGGKENRNQKGEKTLSKDYHPCILNLKGKKSLYARGGRESGIRRDDWGA